ncbi:hypothetical protein BC943DRAFT_343385 [Umbelopsis sp. AD052]|nr:hypothetical protein BC943DRAFT_343385 [Umbelopsis sp. AD052]
MDETRQPLLSDRQEDEEEREISSPNGRDASYHRPVFVQPGKFTSLEKLLFFVSSVLLILLSVFAGLYARSAMEGKPPVPGPPKSDPPTETPPADEICTKPECVITASQILQDMDQTADPCDDFYQYACGNWIETHPIPESKSRIGTFDNLFENNMKAIQKILSKDFSSVVADVEGELPPPDKVIDEQNFKKIKDFYESCLDEDSIDSVGAEPLYPMFEEIQKLLPLSDLQNQDAKKISNVLSYLMQRGVNPLFQLAVSPDDKDPDSYAVQMWQSGLGMNSKEYYEDEFYVKSYQEIVTEILQVLFSKDNGKFGWKYNNPGATAKRIVDFEKALAKISDTSDQLQDPESIYNPFTISQLHERSASIDWDLLITELLPSSVSRPKQIIVSSPNYLGNLSTPLLQSTNSRSLQFYFIWHTLLNYIDDLGEEFTKPKRKLDALLSGVSARVSKPRWEYCIRQLDNSLGFLVGRYYVLDQFKGDARERADSFVESINDAFVDRLPDLEWIDDTTKARAVEKVRALTRKIGYPTGTPDTLSPVSLSEFYNGLHVNKGDHFGNILSANAFDVRSMWKRIGKPVDRSMWEMTPQTVNAYYNPPGNEIVFPAGILQRPYFNLDDPDYLNYGGIGVVVGHELTHGFDDNGRQYDPEGKLRQWWTDETVEAFKVKAQCFIDQYSNFTVKGPKGEEVHVNGKLTLGENLADNGGLREAFSAWKRRFDQDVDLPDSEKKWNNVILPGLEHLSREKLFYVNFGRVWCGKSTPAKAVLGVRTDPHSPPSWRAMGAVQNSQHFAETFQCKKGSNMNPVSKCDLW